MRCRFSYVLLGAALAAAWTLGLGDNPARKAPAKAESRKEEPRQADTGKSEPQQGGSGKADPGEAGEKKGEPEPVPLITLTTQEVFKTVDDVATAGKTAAVKAPRPWNIGKPDASDHPSVIPKPDFSPYPGFDPERPPAQSTYHYYTDGQGVDVMTSHSYQEWKEWKAKMQRWTEAKQEYDRIMTEWREKQLKDLRRQGVPPGRIRQMEKDGLIGK